MAEAFNSRSNQIVSDSAAQINASDDVSTADADESVLGRTIPPDGRNRRRRGDEEEGADLYDDDDMESIVSQPLNGANGKVGPPPEEEVELPSHACA